mmetsp:Transcript_85552/g.170811  ORF Transcript_85552/g.170811 Transcript_85552/m.170811 type:complete len:160 (-) Transcript_85552:4-483(-)
MSHVPYTMQPAPSDYGWAPLSAETLSPIAMEPAWLAEHPAAKPSAAEPHAAELPAGDSPAVQALATHPLADPEADAEPVAKGGPGSDAEPWGQAGLTPAAEGRKPAAEGGLLPVPLRLEGRPASTAAAKEEWCWDGGMTQAGGGVSLPAARVIEPQPSR